MYQSTFLLVIVIANLLVPQLHALPCKGSVCRLSTSNNNELVNELKSLRSESLLEEELQDQR